MNAHRQPDEHLTVRAVVGVVALSLALVVLGVIYPTRTRAEVVAAPIGAIPNTLIRLLNDRDQLVVEDFMTGSGALAVWSPETGLAYFGEMQDPLHGTGPLGVSSINESGLVTGVAGTAPNIPFVFSFASMRRTPLDRSTFSRAHATHVADDGTIVGWLGEGLESNSHAVAWRGADHRLVMLPDLGYGSMAASVNDHGLAAGFVFAADGTSHPAVWDLVRNVLTDVSALTGTTDRLQLPATVNDLGQVLFALSGASPAGSDVVVDTRTNTARTLGPSGSTSLPELNGRGEVAFYDKVDRSLVLVDTATDARRVLEGPGAQIGNRFQLNDVGQVLLPQTVGGLRTILFDPAAGRLDLGDGGGAYVLPTSLNNTGLLGGYTWSGLRASIAPLPLVPLPPTGLQAAISDGTVTLTWSPAEVPSGRRPITSYELQRDGVAVGTAEGAARTWSASLGPEPFGAHSFTVAAVNVIGRSAPATVQVQQVASEVPVVLPPAQPPARAVAATPTFTG